MILGTFIALKLPLTVLHKLQDNNEHTKIKVCEPATFYLSPAYISQSVQNRSTKVIVASLENKLFFS